MNTSVTRIMKEHRSATFGAQADIKCSTQMTIEGRDHDGVVRDPDHGQSKGHLVFCLCSKMTPGFSFF